MANGRQSDVELSPLPSYTKEVVAPYVGSALLVAGSAALIAWGFASGLPALGFMSGGRSMWKGAAGGFREASDAKNSFHSDLQSARAKRLSTCIRYFSKAVEMNKMSDTSFFKLAQLYQAAGKLEVALGSVNKAIDINSKELPYWILLGILFLQLERLQDSINAFSHVVVIDPDNYYAWCNLGVAYSSLDNDEEAERCWQTACRIDPDKPLAWLNKAVILDKKMKYAEATECWQRAATADSQIMPPWQSSYDTGQTLLSQGKFVEALEQYESTFKYKSEWSQARIGKALCLKHVVGLQAAAHEFRAILDTDPDNVAVLFNLGNIVDEQGLHSEAMKYWIRAFHLDPTCKVPWVRAYNKSQEFFRNGQTEMYMDALIEALRLYPEFALAWFEKGLLHYSMQDMPAAETCWLRVLELGRL